MKPPLVTLLAFGLLTCAAVAADPAPSPVMTVGIPDPATVSLPDRYQGVVTLEEFRAIVAFDREFRQNPAVQEAEKALREAQGKLMELRREALASRPELLEIQRRMGAVRPARPAGK